MEIKDIIYNSIMKDEMIQCILSTPKNNLINKFKKVTIRPVKIKNETYIQFEKFTDTQVFHENKDKEEALNLILDLIINNYKYAKIFTIQYDYQILISKKGKIKVIQKPASKKKQNINHDRSKKYIIEENTPCDFLIELGVMNEVGKVYKKKYDKFRQINKFLEMVDDAVDDNILSDDFTIIDFGCGKAYLMFALYYYFTKIRNIQVKIIGLDLKEDVIQFCQNVSEKLNYQNLKFKVGNIQDYTENTKVNMVVTLHACDTATDAALVKAIKWNADIIMSVPCCQHELFGKIDNDNLKPMLKYGLIKERLSSLTTDTLRGLFLETKGYDVQLLEFIALEHTPKNILIRAVKVNRNREKAQKEYTNFKEFWKLDKMFIEDYYLQETKKLGE